MDQMIIGGVDTHAATHHAAAIDNTGRLLATAGFEASEVGYRSLVEWMRSHGSPIRIGVEGTGTYGAGLTRHLHRSGIDVVEVPRPDRRLRRAVGKSDPIDAEAAARRALSGDRGHHAQDPRRPSRGDPSPQNSASWRDQGKDSGHQHVAVNDHHRTRRTTTATPRQRPTEQDHQRLCSAATRPRTAQRAHPGRQGRAAFHREPSQTTPT